MEILNFLEEIGLGADLTSSAIGILTYVLQALALYTIADRRGIKNPWLAWVPVASVWILGSISDQYRYVTKREVKNMRKVLLGLNIATSVFALIFFVILIGVAAEFVLSSSDFVTGILPGSNTSDIDKLLEAVTDNIGILLGSCFALIGFGIASAICSWIAMYDLFLSCEPANATVYMVISVVGGFVVNGIQCIFLMLCRNKDLGMPPRKESTPPPVVEYQPEEPWVQE